MKAVNLLPPELRHAPASPAKRPAEPDSGGPAPYIVLGALALSVAALSSWVLTGNTLDQRKVELAAATARQQTAQARAATLKPYADFAAIAAARVTTVKQLADSRFAWERALRDISLALPSDVTVDTLEGSIATGAGGGSSPLRGAIESPAVELTGCATNQRAVAGMLGRLRAVNGVTRVSLSKSDKGEKTPETPGAIAPVEGVGGAGVIGCAGDNPPDFELTMFFETQSALSAEPIVTTGDPAAAATPVPGAAPVAGEAAPGTVTPAATPAATTTTPAQGEVTP